MSSPMIIACPTCAQKYRVSAERLGQHAHCNKCGQRFRIETDQPIDDDTIMGWVMEEDQDSPSDQSVLGSTSIFAPTRKGHPPRPTLEQWQPQPPPDKPRLRLEGIDEMGACFEFPATELGYRDIRASFPYRCVHCLRKDHLEVRLIIWGDKLPRKDAFYRKEIETKVLGRLDQLLRGHRKRWFERLEPLTVLPPPFCNPFPYFVCGHCTTAGEVTAQVLSRDGEEFCRIAIANLEIARRFFYNNGGKNTMGYQKLVEVAARQRDDKWQRIAFPVRKRISLWFKPHEKERFLGYFADSDFSRTETGSAGVVLTDRRLIYKKYGNKREFNVDAGGMLDIQADKRTAVIRISQSGAPEATLHSNPLAASHLAKALTKLAHPWQIKVRTPDITA